MSKVMPTSGNQSPVVKGSATGGDAADGGASGMFDALFCGMQQAAVNADADAPQTQTDSADSEKITDPHLAILLDSINPPHSGNRKKGSQISDEPQKDDTDLDTDKLADAGLLALDSQLPDAGRRRSSQFFQQGLSTMASLAEDLKKAQTGTSAAQAPTAPSLSAQDEGFIGPPLPQAMQKSGLAGLEQNENNSKKFKKTALQTNRLHTDMLKSPVLKTQVLDNTPAVDFSEEMADTDILDAAALKAERLAEVPARISVRPARTVAPSIQLTSLADGQTGLSPAVQQTNSAQTGGQQSGTGSAFSGTAPTDLAEQWLDILDMQDEKWTDELVRRIDREFRTGGKGLELEMNPRNLGRLRVSLSVTQDQTNVVLRTETGAAAQLLTEAEARLAQMLGEAGLKLGQFDAFSGGQNRGFGQQDSQQEQNGTMAEAENDDQIGDTDILDGLVNLRA